MQQIQTTKEDQFEAIARKFCKDVERLKAEDNSMTYLECVAELCLANDIEVENVKAMLSKPILDKMQAEAMERNLLKFKNNTLF